MRMELLRKLMQDVSGIKGEINTRKTEPKSFNARRLGKIVSTSRSILSNDVQDYTPRDYINASQVLRAQLLDANPQVSKRTIKRLTQFIKNLAIFGADSVSVRKNLKNVGFISR
jgi:hypothetical protein